MFLPPIPGFAHAPNVDDIADQIQVLRFSSFQKIEEKFRVAAARAEMNI